MSSSLDKKRSVSFDEELNQVREYDPVPPEDKANVWLSKVQIRENRIQVAEELMMEKTKDLVKSKLIEETILPTHQARIEKLSSIYTDTKSWVTSLKKRRISVLSVTNSY